MPAFSTLIPPSYIISGVEREDGLPIAPGDVSDVFPGLYRGNSVAIKCRTFSARDDLEAIKKALQHEVGIWGRLRHENILHFFGVVLLNEFLPPWVVSSWMENGKVTEYVRTNPGANRPQLVMELCKGLQYLHSLDIVHGNLKGDHVLVSSSGHVRLAGFGFSIVRKHLEPVDFAATMCYPYTSWRWMSPELLFPETIIDSTGGPSKSSDVYALGMTILEVFSGNPPFDKVTEMTAVSRVGRGERPARPDGALALGLSDGIWALVCTCWDLDRSNRPTVSFFLERM